VHVFLAGATGVLGRRVLPLLRAEGHRVTALTRTDAGAAAVRTAGGTPVIGPGTWYTPGGFMAEGARSGMLAADDARKHLGWVPAHPSWRTGFFA
jgi:hypothetical protein